MRTKLKDLRKNPTWIGSWLCELPMRHRSWWSEALFEPGTGWLKWGADWRERICYDPPDMEQWVVYPPLRRAYMQLRWVLAIPRLVLREHLSWEEVRPDFSCLRADPERRKDLWR